jgi:hypothetical protein
MNRAARIGLAGVALAIIGYASWTLRKEDASLWVSHRAGALPRSSSLASVPSLEDSRSEQVPAVFTPEVPDPDGGAPLVPALPLQTGELAWEKRIRKVLANEQRSDSEKARALLEMLPTLPVEGRETAAIEAIQRLPDREYAAARDILINPNTYGLALAVMWSDLMERPDDITLPTLLAIARNPAHPFARNAAENLELLLGQSFGTDWQRWDASIRERTRKR